MKESPKQEGTPTPHLVSLSDRNRLSVSGVQDVDSFDETTVVVYTVQGELTVKGADLRISRLNTETGDLTMEGTVDSLIYVELHRHSGGFFSRLFR